ncbi:PIR Superfamily Protein [Plasmodium ovale curtisi]|uniref:PIR Superfamily Protein n=1 Tax=Plasmodium ovale curtisi TaxID=864141 RepID=A0A1A8XBL3_PLAOA|nr:PIR Superfamily Protein [Plasmodium ovale curtisi]
MADGIPEESGGFANTYLSVLPSVKFYHGVKKDNNDLSNYSQQCEKIYVTKNNDEVRTICEKFIRHLEKSTVWDFPNPGYDVCLLLNYWVYDKLNHVFNDKGPSDIAFGNFQYIWNYPSEYLKRNISFDKKCKYKIDVHKHEDWNKRKQFYDYCVDYDTLKGLIITYPEKCNDFYEYIEKKEELYKYIQNICSTEPKECPIFFQECREYDPNLLLSKLPCREEMVQKKAAAQTPVLQLDSKQEPGFGAGTNEPDVSGLPSSVTASTQENSDIGTKFGHSFLGVAPVLLTATALYRYTPIGSWIRNFGGNTTNNISGINEGEIEGFLPNTQDSGDMLFGDSSNYISYQPL